jgi:hypothetical protein
LNQELHETQQKVGKYFRGGEGCKGDFEGFIVELCDYGGHTQLSGGRDEKCSSLS